ncbi:hypothetical protein D0Z00_002044 [Geotrichum galactomycetum]|uniref:Uncharacterized protein n=1 Tax=Geotrichum galactomycetum TaxID=27317 RepID=A0ACB6V589_9ASCO|nr:hypothetical protein D0Z00_002044 [Geotrichum candidum]
MQPFLFLLLALSVAATVTAQSAGDLSYIVRFPDVSSELLHKRDLSYHTQFFAKLAADGIDYLSRFNYSSPALHGASVVFRASNNPNQAKAEAELAHLIYLRSLDGIVDKAWPATKIPHVKKDTIISDTDEENTGNIKADPSDNKKKKRAAKRDTSSRTCPRDVSIQSPWTAVHESTNVNKLHKRGIKGSGVVIAVIDTGIDTLHPDFANKIVGGWDFVGDNPAPGSFHPGPDFTDKDGHGTQAAGIAVGNSNRYTGVAPEAKLLAYRVYYNIGSYVDEDTLLAAIERAYSDGADVISFSIGSPQAFAGNPIGIAADNLVSKGIIFVIAAGNNGLHGPYNPLNGGGSSNSLAVATVESEYLATWPITAVAGASEQTRSLTYISTNGAYFGLNGTQHADYSPTNACEIDARVGNSSLIVLPRGSCTDVEQFGRLNDLGYNYALLVNGPNNVFLHSFNVTYTKTLKAGGFIDTAHSGWLAAQADAGNSLIIQFNNNTTPIPVRSVYAGAGYPNRITSWGPTYENFFYPSVAAPGGDVLAPTPGGSYLTVSGTSFATPYMAGVAALYLSSKGISRSAGTASTSAALDFNKRVIGTARVLDFFDGTAPVSGVQAPLIQQGAGFVDAARMVDQDIHIQSDPLISLNDTRYRQAAQKIKIKNTSNKLLSYTVRHVPGTAVTVANSAGIIPEFPPPYSKDKRAVVTFLPAVWVLTPGHSTNIYAYFSFPSTTKEGIVYSGKLEITASNGDVVGVPYMAVQQDTNALISPFPSPPVLLKADSTTGQYAPIPDDGSAVFNFAQYDAPVYSAYSNFGTRFASVDLVTTDFDLDAAVAANAVTSLPSRPGYLGPAGIYDPSSGAITFPQTPFPRIQQGNLDFPVIGFTENFAQLESGSYRVLTRALRPFGALNKSKDWVFHLSPAFKVVYE